MLKNCHYNKEPTRAIEGLKVSEFQFILINFRTSSQKDFSKSVFLSLKTPLNWNLGGRLNILLLLIFFLPFSAFAIPENERETLQKSRKDLVDILEKNIIPYWCHRVIDRLGGYSLNHDITGKVIEPSNKSLITQARTLWFFSKLYADYSPKPEYLKTAKQGYDFLIKSMKDPKNGGYYWEVSSSGDFAVKPNKHLYGQAFALYALSEYALASGDPQAKQEAETLFNLILDKSYDNKNKGFNESFRKSWKPELPPEKNYMNVSPDLKLMNTHLHMMEALTTYYRLTKDPQALKLIRELIKIQSDTVILKKLPASTDKFLKNWERVTGEEYDRVSYGHDLENIWLLREALEVTGQPATPYLPLFKKIFAYAKQYGFDTTAGGYYEGGRFNEPADKRNKVWWIQAEALVAALTMYQLTREKEYLDNYVKTLEWIKNHQVDWKYGEWYQIIDGEGIPRGVKGSAWKSAYHDGRAMIETIHITDSLLSEPNQNK